MCGYVSLALAARGYIQEEDTDLGIRLEASSPVLPNTRVSPAQDQIMN